jgi:CDP-diacylglycerol---serine O-phosphatidyltransferase
MSKAHPRRNMLSFAKDIPNMISLLGLLCSILGIYFVIEGYFLAGIISILWAVLFDWLDGIIARKIKDRTKEQGVFGEQLDSMIDIVSFGVFPAILLLSYGNYSAWFIPGSFIIVASCSIRLSYFNLYGLIDSKTYMGLALDNNVLILAFIFLFESFFNHTTFSIILYIVLLILTTLNLSSIPTPKLGTKWIYALVVYVLVLTSVLGSILWSRI